MNVNRRRLILFARYPEPGFVKTRLIPVLGAEGAAALHRRLVLRTLRTALAACHTSKAELEIRFDGGDERAMRHWLGDGFLCRPQSGGDLGGRMSHAFDDSFREGSSATVIVGSDCPELTPRVLTAAFERLTETPSVFGPARDGGYYLVGLSRPVPALFQHINWGTDTVLAESLSALEQIGVGRALLSPLNDLDLPADLPGWQRIAEADEAGPIRVSVIVPALNEAERIAVAIAAAREGQPHEIVVVDGGSADGTTERAKTAGAIVLASDPGRARQMNAGAARASGNALLFLHADTLLPRNYLNAVSTALRQPRMAAGAFQFQIEGGFAGKALVEWTANLRSRWRQLPFGDQALFLRRSVFEEIGGYADLPIMEDYELVRRLRRRGRVITVPQTAITSGRRWRRRGVVRTTLTNWLIQAGYGMGVAPEKLAKLYRG